MITWHLEKWKIKDLKDYHKNPRKISKHDADNLKESLKEFGLVDKPIITKEGTIIGGHQRKRCLKALGYKEIECWVPNVDLNDKQVEKLNLMLNRVHGEFDYDILANEFEIPDLLDSGFLPTDFDLEDILDEKKEETEKDHGKKCPTCGKKMKNKICKSD